MESQLIVLVKLLCENFESELKEAFRFCKGLKIPNIEKQAKISWQRVTQEPSFIIESDYYLLDSMAFLTHYSLSELHYLLGFLNSKAIFYYFKHIGHLYSDKGFLLSNQYVERFPIPKTSDIDAQTHREILACVKEILEAKNVCHSEPALAGEESHTNHKRDVSASPQHDKIKNCHSEACLQAEESHNPPPNPLRKGRGKSGMQNLCNGRGNNACRSEPALTGSGDSSSDTSRLESRLDSLIYQAYNLTQDEIALIESEFSTRERERERAEIIENLYYLLESFVRDSKKQYQGKIVYPVIAKEMSAHLDMQGFFANDKCFILTLNRYNKNTLFYLIALFNSKTMFWYFQQIGATLGANGYEMRKIFIEKLPIPKITKSNQKIVDSIIALVDEILAVKADSAIQSATKVAPPNTSKLEFEINSLVYRLYGLSDEEIGIIENKQLNF